MQNLLGATLIGCLLLGASSANAQPAPDLDWRYLDCESSETTEGICPEVENLVQFVSRCVVAVSELRSQGWSLVATERLFDQTTVQLFAKGFETRAVYCIFNLEIED